LVKEKGLEKKVIDNYEKLNKLWKDLDHNLVTDIKPEHLKEAMNLSIDIITKMKKLLPKEIKEFDVGFSGLM
jgi:DNA-directed RNA polymerase sigma subunit (sigma70/sigma32)